MSYKFEPFSYINIVIIGTIIFIISLMMDTFIDFPVDLLSIVFLFLLSFICICNTVLIFREGFRIKNILIYIIFTLYIVTIYFLCMKHDLFHDRFTPLIIFLKLVMHYLESTVIAIWIMGYAVLKIKPSYNNDYIVILGCSISKKGHLRPLLQRRVNCAIHFAWEQEINTGKPAFYVPTGGKGNDEPLSEGSAMELYLLCHGAEENEVFPDKKATNTRENIIFSKRIIDNLKENAKIAIVTSDFHVLRSGILAKKECLNFQVIGSKSKWYFWPNAFFRETIAIMYMNKKTHIAATFICAAIAMLCITIYH